ncbi:MAG: hypothetical protein JO204_11355 [Alphaproteobacteria bacterium]|nr:hypothetical protein [Alphaproteobacteria bacterium]
MPYPPIRHIRLAFCAQTAALILVITAAILLPNTLARAEEPGPAANAPAAAASDSAGPAAGPLTPVHQEPSAGAPSGSKTTTAKKPTITMPPPASTPTDAAGPAAPAGQTQAKQAEEKAPIGVTISKPPKPQPKQAKEAAPVAPTISKAAKPLPKQAKETTLSGASARSGTPTQAEEALPPRPHRKPPSKATATVMEREKKAAPVERRTAVVERRERVYRDQPDERISREYYDWTDDAPVVERRVPPFGPPRIYADEAPDAGPTPFAPPWYYRGRPLAWGPYPGMRFPPPMPW